MKFLEPGKYLMLGDEALAEGAIMADCKFVAGYPITPASEVLSHIARRFVEFPDRFYVQMEDEIGSMAAIIGASWAGAKAMTATSGPGFSLMQENLSYAYMTETPCVVAVLQRGGPSTGQPTYPAQQEFYQARYGAHGDYASIVLSPWSVQEMFDLVIDAFNYAERYRVPVIFLADGELAHIREPLIIPPKEEIKLETRKLPSKVPYPAFLPDDDLIPPMPLLGQGHNVLVTGSSHEPSGLRNYDPKIAGQLVKRLRDKIEVHKSDIFQYEYTSFSDHAKNLLISFGVTARMTWAAAKKLTENGIPTDFLRLKTLWPLDDNKLRPIIEDKENIFVVELNLGQLIREIERIIKIPTINLFGINPNTGALLSSNEIAERVKKIVGEV